MKIEKTITHTKCSVHTMSDGCFNQIDNYLRNFPEIMGDTVEETKKNIEQLPQFKNGCFTYLQSRAFAEYYHSI